MEFSASEVSALLKGNLIGNPDVKVNTILPIENATKGALSFISNPKYEKYLKTTKASVVLVSKKLELPSELAPTVIQLEDVYTAFSTLLKQVESMASNGKIGIEQPSFIADSATVSDKSYIGAFAYIGKNVIIKEGAQIYPHTYIGDNSIVGENTTLYSGVKIYPKTLIGKNVIIHSGAVIGSDGFGFAPQPDGSFIKMPQTGNVIINDHVEIGANTTIDRATIESTIIEQGAKLDNLVQIAHNVVIGKNTAIAAQAGISGSTKVGENCLIGGQAGIVGHISIAKRNQIGAKAGIGKSITKEGGAWSGRPAIEHAKSLKIQAINKQLPELVKDIRILKKAVEALKIQGR